MNVCCELCITVMPTRYNRKSDLKGVAFTYNELMMLFCCTKMEWEMHKIPPGAETVHHFIHVNNFEMCLRAGRYAFAFTSVTIKACTPFLSEKVPVSVTFSPASFLASSYASAFLLLSINK